MFTSDGFLKMGQTWNCEWFGFRILKGMFLNDNDCEKCFKVLGWMYSGLVSQGVKLMVRPEI